MILLTSYNKDVFTGFIKQLVIEGARHGSRNGLKE